jgi:hypothetical protein
MTRLGNGTHHACVQQLIKSKLHSNKMEEKGTKTNLPDLQTLLEAMKTMRMLIVGLCVSCLRFPFASPVFLF